MIYFLGQAVLLNKQDNKPGIVTKIGPGGSPYVSYIQKNGELRTNEFFTESELSFPKEKDKTSPSGEKIYYGKFCKYIKINDAEMKIPATKELETEISTILNLIK